MKHIDFSEPAHKIKRTNVWNNSKFINQTAFTILNQSPLSSISIDQIYLKEDREGNTWERQQERNLRFL